MAVLRDEAELFWCKPPPIARFAVVLGCIATVVVPAVAATALYRDAGIDIPYTRFSFCYSLSLAALAAIAAIAFALGRWVHIAVLLPLVHVGLLACGWHMWRELDAAGALGPDARIATATPLGLTAAALAACGALLAIAITRGRSRRRRRDTTPARALATFALAFLLALGLWLPLVATPAAALGDVVAAGRAAFAFEHPASVALVAALPPLALAAWHTARARRSSRRSGAWRLGLLALFAIDCRLACGLGDRARMVYSNFVPLVLAAALLACAALVVLLASELARSIMLTRALAGPRARSGRIASDGAATGARPAIGVAEIAGWLRPPRFAIEPFALALPDGAAVPIHAAQLIAPMPAGSIALAVGESIAILRAGDAVVVARLGSAAAAAADTDADADAATAGDPYRSPAQLAGVDVVVAPADARALTFGDIALAAWRPAVAYLAILAAIALPGFIALQA